MKKGHPFIGYEETVHSVYSIESKPGEVQILGFVEKREESE